MVLKFFQQMKHAQRTEKYIQLIFNSYISDGDFFFKVHAHYRHELVFFWRFSRVRGGAHYATLMTVSMLVLCKADIFIISSNVICSHQDIAEKLFICHKTTISHSSTQIRKGDSLSS